MSARVRKIFCSIIGAAVICAALILGLQILGEYSHTVPVPVGPYRQILFLLLGLIFAASAGFFFYPLTGETAAGTACIAFCILWFAARIFVGYREPDGTLLLTMDRWMPVPLMAFGAGAALWAGVLFRGRFSRRSVSEKWQLIPALLLVFISLQPVLSGGFNWDDAFFSVEAQAMRISGEPILARIWKEIIDYARIGRINPFATFHFLVFYLFHDAFAYKLLLVLLTLLNGGLFYRFLRLWKEDRHPALSALLIVPLCFQLRLYHDPLNSYYGLMQVMFCELMGSLTGFVLWLRGGGKKHLIFSLLLFTAGLMSYEMFFPLIALFLIPALMHEKKIIPAIRRSLPYILTAGVLFTLSMLLRNNITEETAYNGTTFSIDPGTILRALWYQLGAAFPLSYRTAGYDGALFGKRIPWRTVFNSSVSVFLRSIQWQDLLGCAVLILLFCGSPREKKKIRPGEIVFALLLWVLPGTLIALSSKYQHELHPGLAYIPVYFSCFGAAMLLYQCAILLGRIVDPRPLRTVLAGIACAVLLITAQDNRHISRMLNDIFQYPRSVGEAALQAGLLGENPEDYSRVLSDRPYSLWEHGWMMEPYQSAFYSLNARTKIKAIGAADFVTRKAEAGASGWTYAPNSLLVSYSGDSASGFAKRGKIRMVQTDPETGTLPKALVTDIFFYVSGTNESGKTLIYETKKGETVRIPVEEAWLIRKTDKGTLYKLDEKLPVKFETVGIYEN